MKLASERKWEALDEMCWKTCLEDEKKAQQKGMSSQDFIELCKKKRGSQDETSQQEGTSSQEGLSQHGTSQQEDPCRRATENQT